MIYVYDKNEIKFETNGLCAIKEVAHAVVENTLNGIYKLELTISISDSKLKYIKNSNILKVNTPEGWDLFRIFKTTTTNDYMNVEAIHITYDLENNFINSCKINNLNCSNALIKLIENCNYKSEFKLKSDIETTASAFYVRKTFAEALWNSDNSILNKYKGELYRHKFEVLITKRIGVDKGYKIQYANNLLGFECTEDISGVVTKIIPTALYQNDTVLTLPELFVTSKNLNNYPHPIVRHYHFSDLKVGTTIIGDKILDEADIQQELRKKAQKMFENGIDTVRLNYKINFIDLSDTIEFKNCKFEKLQLGDIVTVINTKLNLTTKQRVVKYTYNVISNRLIEIELNSIESKLENQLFKTIEQLNDVKETVRDNNSKTLDKFNETDVKIEQTAEKISTEVKNNKEELNSKIEQTADRITTEVKNNKEELNSKIEQTASSITSEVNDNKKELHSKIEQTADRITTEVKNNKEELNSKIEQTASSITSEVNDNKKELHSKIEQTAEKISTEVADNKLKLNTRITQTAEKIVAEVINNKQRLNSKIEQTAEKISTEVKNNKEELNSKIEQTADRITTEVEDVRGDLKSRINQTADKIEMVVDSRSNIKASKIALAISESGSAIDLISDHIYIRPHDGVIHFPNGSDIDTRSGRLRLRYSSDEYLAVGGDFDFYKNGQILASITNSGIYHKGERLLKQSDLK